ncbi:ribonuclease T1 [Actimicrobium sp. GrIS 1.19]|nr:ribonuclease T1 [Actimicrobium sp. GrIS 1.19]
MIVNAQKLGMYGFAAILFASTAFAKQPAPQTGIGLDVLPPEASTTLALIKRGGPFPYEKDGVVFGNYEQQLPRHRRGYYHEYTVPTPRAHNRGARRIIVGGKPAEGADYFYTADHYATFQRIVEK